MKNRQNFFRSLLLGSMVSLTLASCSDKTTDPNKGEDEDDTKQLYNVVLSTSTEGTTETYVQSLEDLSTGSITFSGFGFKVPSTRTARVYASESGSTLYNLDYGGGGVYSYETTGGENYTKISESNVAPIIGTEYPRWTQVSETSALVHNVVVENQFNADNSYNYTKAEAFLTDVELPSMLVGDLSQLEIPRSEEDIDNNLYISRIDAPAIINGKAYYGVTKSKRNPEDPSSTLSGIVYSATTLVVDYPSLKNPELTSSSLAEGSTYGYRIPVSHIHNDAVYQITRDGFILKMKDGKYDDSYEFNISTALGKEVGALGWFYVGDGIGYCTTYDAEAGSSEAAAAWGITRVDLNSRTAISMNVPTGLYLFQYQMSKVVDGKLYMALSPVGAKGNIYIFDASKASADGFEVGAELNTGAGASYVGVF